MLRAGDTPGEIDAAYDVGGTPGTLEALFSRPVPLWSLLLMLVAALAAVIGFGALVDGWQKAGGIGRAAIALARVPDTIKNALKSNAPYYGGKDFEPLPAGFWRDAAFKDEGYALISPYDMARGRSVVRLVRLSDGATVREFVPDVDSANARSAFVSALTDVRRDKPAARNRLMHPLLLADGSLVVHDSSPLVRVDACGKELWAVDGIFNHSAELGAEGQIWAPYRLPVPSQKGVARTFWDDALGEVSQDGKLIGVTTVAEILDRNGLGHLWRGRPYSDDPFHLNDIQPVLADGPHWKRGDLFLSLRNLSMVALYRPATGKILWHQSRPWRFQHDVTILDDHRISVFDNNVRLGYPNEGVNTANRLIVVDFASGGTSAPW
ncbi:MAG: arylsulfotransferase family protein, partial [Sphingomonas sp.]